MQREHRFSAAGAMQLPTHAERVEHRFSGAAQMQLSIGITGR